MGGEERHSGVILNHGRFTRAEEVIYMSYYIIYAYMRGRLGDVVCGCLGSELVIV